MLGIDIRVARAAWTVFLFALVVATVYAIRETLGIFVVALFFAYLLSPVVDAIENRLPKRVSKPIALLIVYMLLIGLLIAAGFSIGARLTEEASNLTEKLPQYFKNTDWMQRFPLPYWLEPMRERLISMVQSQFKNGGRDWTPYLTEAGTKVLSSISGIFFIVLIPILAFFFLKDGTNLRETFVGGLGNERTRSLAESILTDVHTLLAQYIRALVLLALGTFTSYLLFLSITGASYFFLLAGTAALLEFIPVVGPLAAGGIVILVTVLSGYPHVLWFVVFWLCYRLFQDYVISPYLMSAGVEVHPLLVLFGVLAGEQIAGIPGMFFSVPVIATLRVIYTQAQRARLQRKLSPSPLA